MITEVSIRCPKNPEVGIQHILAYTPQYTTGFRQTVHTHRAPVHQAAKLVAALLRVARLTAGLAESNGSLPPGLWLTSPAGWLPRTGISARQLSLGYLYLLPTQPPTTVLRPLYRSTCISRHVQLRTGGLCWCKVFLPTFPCWQEPAHSDYGEDAGVLLNSFTYTVSVTCL